MKTLKEVNSILVSDDGKCLQIHYTNGDFGSYAVNPERLAAVLEANMGTMLITEYEQKQRFEERVKAYNQNPASVEG
jgi:hypothetical protein